MELPTWKHNGYEPCDVDGTLLAYSPAAAVWDDKDRMIAALQSTPLEHCETSPEEADKNARLIVAGIKAIDFAVQYLWSEHGICHPEDYAAPYSSEQLRDKALVIVNEAMGRKDTR